MSWQAPPAGGGAPDTPETLGSLNAAFSHGLPSCAPLNDGDGTAVCLIRTSLATLKNFVVTMTGVAFYPPSKFNSGLVVEVSEGFGNSIPNVGNPGCASPGNGPIICAFILNKLLEGIQFAPSSPAAGASNDGLKFLGSGFTTDPVCTGNTGFALCLTTNANGIVGIAFNGQG